MASVGEPIRRADGMKATFDPIRLASLMAAVAVIVSSTACSIANAQVELVPQPDAANSFDFETEKLTGTIRTDGAYHGVSRLTLKSSGRQFIDERYAALNLFKLMSVNQVMDQPRHMERTFSSGDTWVEIQWAPSEGHAGELTARYEIHPPDAIDLVVTAETNNSYSGYEVFMSSYFDKALRPNVHLQSRGSKAPEWVVPRFSEVFKDTLLVFPRDAHAGRLCLDGRWDRSERKAPTIQLTPARHYASALAIMTDEDEKTAVMLMAKPEHVYAISTRYFSENEELRNTSYSAFDFALFGKDLNAGDRRSVRVRLSVVSLEDGDLEAPLQRYQAFLEEDLKP